MVESPGEQAPPSAEELAQLLGPAGGLWTSLRERILSAGGSERWVYGGRKYGWSCRFERGRRGILYLTAASGHFRVGLALSDGGRAAVLSSDLPDALRRELAAAAKAMEGWPIRMAVSTEADLEVVFRLADIKLSS